MTDASPSTGDGRPPGIPEAVLTALEAHLKDREQRREAIGQRARALRRLSQATVTRLLVEGSGADALAAIRRDARALSADLKRGPPGDEGIATDAFQEAAEASLLGAILGGEAVPGPDDLGLEPEPYLLGLGDVVGELRRVVLDALGRDDLARAERFLGWMDRLTETLVRFETTRAIVPLKPKQDLARAVLERTRGDLVMARLLARARPRSTGGAP